MLPFDLLQLEIIEERKKKSVLTGIDWVFRNVHVRRCSRAGTWLKQKKNIP